MIATIEYGVSKRETENNSYGTAGTYKLCRHTHIGGSVDVTEVATFTTKREAEIFEQWAQEQNRKGHQPSSRAEEM